MRTQRHVVEYQDSAFVTLISYSTDAEAELACQKLRNNKIDTYVANTATQMIVGQGALYPCELKVRIRDVKRAQEILAEEAVVALDKYEPKYEQRRRLGKIILVVVLGTPLLISLYETFFK